MLFPSGIAALTVLSADLALAVLCADGAACAGLDGFADFASGAAEAAAGRRTERATRAW